MGKTVLVKRTAGDMVDFNRAALIMDRDLLGLAMFDTMAECNNPATDYCLQDVWIHYCKLHEEKYGTPFKPDVNGDWA